jgi:hypothetical protein
MKTLSKYSAFGTISILLMLFFQYSCNIDSPNCSKYKNGYFGYANSNGELSTDTVIFRKEEYQMEYIFSTKTWLLLDVEWHSECEYYIKPVSTNDSNSPINKGGLKIEITSVDSISYDIYYDLPKEKMFAAGKVFDLESELSQAKKDQIQKVFSSAILDGQ